MLIWYQTLLFYNNHSSKKNSTYSRVTHHGLPDDFKYHTWRSRAYSLILKASGALCWHWKGPNNLHGLVEYLQERCNYQLGKVEKLVPREVTSPLTQEWGILNPLHDSLQVNTRQEVPQEIVLPELLNLPWWRRGMSIKWFSRQRTERSCRQWMWIIY